MKICYVRCISKRLTKKRLRYGSNHYMLFLYDETKFTYLECVLIYDPSHYAVSREKDVSRTIGREITIMIFV